jgi:hypothetical protein
VDVWVDGVGARKEKERERDGETEREMGRECGRGTRRWASRLSPPLLSLSLSLSQRTEDRHRRLPSFSLSFFFYLLPVGKGYVSGGGRCWLAAVKMERKKKEREGERKRVRENLSPKPGDLL